jgi:DNA-binding HxlR family transcriptional regulator
MNRSYGQACPIARTMDLIGERWTLLILRELYTGRTKFTQIRERSPGLPTKILSDRLKMLEAEGFVRRQLYGAHPLRAEYLLTEKGLSLAPVIEAIVNWGIEHTFAEQERPSVIERIRANLARPGAVGRSIWRTRTMRGDHGAGTAAG